MSPGGDVLLLSNPGASVPRRPRNFRSPVGLGLEVGPGPSPLSVSLGVCPAGDQGCRACNRHSGWHACPFPDCPKHRESVFELLVGEAKTQRVLHMVDNHTGAEVAYLSSPVRLLWGVGVCAAGTHAVGLLKGGYGKVCKVCPKSIKAPPLKSSRGSSTVPPLPSVVPVLRGRSAPRTAGRGRSRKQGIGTEPVPRQVGGSTPSFFSPPVGLYASPPGVSALHARPVVLPSRQSSPTGAPGACVPPLLRGEEEALLSRSGGGARCCRAW